MSKNIYDVNSYSDEELISIMGLNEPTDRELEAAINQRLIKWADHKRLGPFFENVYERFFQDADTEENIEDTNETVQEVSSDKKATKTITKVVSIDSQFRDNKSSFSTDFTTNLSTPLKDVTKLKLYSVQIPYTWYTISKSYGSNFFYILGNKNGINNGYNDYKVEISVGNYSVDTLISAVNNSLTNLSSLYSDTDFSNTSITYDSAQCKATINVDVTRHFGESIYSLEFQEWTSPNESDASYSIPRLLGFNRKIYYPYRIYSNLEILSQNEPGNINIYSLTSNNNYFNIIHYVPTFNNNYSSYLSDPTNNPITIIRNIQINLSNLYTNYSRNDLLITIDNILQNNEYLSNLSSFEKVNETTQGVKGYNKAHYEMNIILDRYKNENIQNSKVVVVFPQDTNVLNDIWVGSNSAFLFNNAINELSDIISETNVVESSFDISNNPYIKLTCNKPNYIDVSNDYIFSLVDSPQEGYILDEYIQAINDAISVTTTETITNSNPNGIFNNTSAQILASRFFFTIDINKAFAKYDYIYDISGTFWDENKGTNFDTYVSNNNYDIENLSSEEFEAIVNTSGNLAVRSTYNISNKSIVKIKNKLNVGLPNINYNILFNTISSNQSITNTVNAIRNVFQNFQDEDGDFILSTTSIENDGWDITLNLQITKYLTEADYDISFVDTSGFDTWRTYLFVGNEEYNLVPVDGSTSASIVGSEPVSQDTIVLTENNNKIYLNPLPIDYLNNSLYSGTNNGIYDDSFVNRLTITIPIGTYPRDQLIFFINRFFSLTRTPNDNNIASGTDISIIGTNSKFTKIRLNINQIYTTQDYNLVFYDTNNFSDTSCTGNIVESAKIDGTLGHILGFQEQLSYSLTSPVLNVKSITGDKTVSISVYKYFMIVLEDYTNSQISAGVITGTTTDTQISTGNSTIKDYESITENGVCEFRVRNIKKNGQRMTQNELYSAQELLNNQKNQVTETNKDNKQLYSTGIYSKNVFALIPLELTKLTNNEIYVDYGTALQDQQRVYFGPVNISRLSVKLINDRGELVDLNGSNWSFTFLAEEQYDNA